MMSMNREGGVGCPCQMQYRAKSIFSRLMANSIAAPMTPLISVEQIIFGTVLVGFHILHPNQQQHMIEQFQ